MTLASHGLRFSPPFLGAKSCQSGGILASLAGLYSVQIALPRKLTLMFPAPASEVEKHTENKRQKEVVFASDELLPYIIILISVS